MCNLKHVSYHERKINSKRCLKPAQNFISLNQLQKHW
uniref:Uncharacterized protein n=1 Tax=Arundo donax TaxID=35708 RepID=A0A0A8XQM1_ARUDO